MRGVFVSAQSTWKQGGKGSEGCLNICECVFAACVSFPRGYSFFSLSKHYANCVLQRS